MASERLSALEMAERQLLAALKLWHERDFIPALTLAGAAEEILGKRVRKLGHPSSCDQIKSDVLVTARSFGDTDPNSERLLAELLNQSRNELKDYDGEESLTFDTREEAAEVIQRALANHQLLTGVVIEEAMGFWADLDDT